MEIKRLPFGQSHADKCRVGYLKWVNAPPGIPREIAIEFMAKLKAGSTVRKLTAGGKILAGFSFGRVYFTTPFPLGPQEHLSKM